MVFELIGFEIFSKLVFVISVMLVHINSDKCRSLMTSNPCITPWGIVNTILFIR